MTATTATATESGQFRPADKPRATAAPAKRRGQAPSGFWSRYRDIIIAVTLFIVIDLGVLVLNFYTSFQISEDAVGVNLSGRQRMLSQRMTKAVLTLDIEQRDGRDGAAALDELRKAVGLFDQSFKGFQTGATVPGGDGKPVFLKAAEGAAAIQALEEAAAIWGPYQMALAPVLEARATPEQLAQAVAFARANNVKLLGLMNNLTTALETNASQRATNLRMVQAAGILLALLNFAYILYKFLSSLRRADSAILAANEENAEILGSVREGLVLLHPDLTLGTQISTSVKTLLGRQAVPGDRLLELLQPLLFEKDLNDARDYMDLLFTPHVRENLVASINPLSSVEVKITNARGVEERKFLSFSFNRVMQDGAVRHLLVTMQDITPRMVLEKQLDAERSRARKEFSSLVQALKADSGVLRQFVGRAESQLLQVNDLLRSVSEVTGSAETRKVIDKVFRLIHSFKGEASALNLELLAGLANQFEDELQTLRDAPEISGESLLNLPLPLENLLEKITVFRQIATASAPAPAAAVEPAPVVGLPDPMAHLVNLAQSVAKDLGKQIRIRVILDNQASPQQLLQQPDLDSIAIQLIRNAVAHGIETPAERQAASKPEAGSLVLQLGLKDNGDTELRLRDDGCGLNPAHIRERLLKLGWITEEGLKDLSDRQVLGYIFKPGFSTSGLSMHAGRGVGLDVVQQLTQSLGGQLRLQSSPGVGTEFIVTVPALA